MNKVVDIADFWQFKITFKEYGLLRFERIQDSELFSWEKNTFFIEETFFEELFKKIFLSEGNTLSIADISFDKISQEEKKEFFEKYFEKQFSSYKIDGNVDYITNFQRACKQYEQKVKIETEELFKTIRDTQAEVNKIMSPVISQMNIINKTLEPMRKQQEIISRMVSSSSLNSIQLAMESIQRKNELLSSMLLPKSVNPFLGITDAVQFPSLGNLNLLPNLRTFDSISNNLDSFNVLRNTIPNRFNYEIGFARNYSEIYSSLNPRWNLLYTENDNSEPYLATKEGQYIPSSNAKDIVGAKELFDDITDVEIANFLGVLEKYPFFASQDPTGKKIYEGLKEHIKTKTIKIKDQVFYRARKWEPSQNIPFTENTMWTAPYGKSGQGRFNVSGIPYLYLAETIEIAKKETSIGTAKKKAHTVMKVTNATELILFDMTSLNSYIFQFCNFKNPDKNYTQYLLPNYIAQCFDYMNKYENIKIDGIKYTSVQNNKDEKYANFVLFNKNQYDFKNAEIVE